MLQFEMLYGYPPFGMFLILFTFRFRSSCVVVSQSANLDRSLVKRCVGCALISFSTQAHGCSSPPADLELASKSTISTETSSLSRSSRSHPFPTLRERRSNRFSLNRSTQLCHSTSKKWLLERRRSYWRISRSSE